MKETRVFVVDVVMVDDNPTTYTDEQFIELARLDGSEYSLKDFEKEFNSGSENISTDFDYTIIPTTDISFAGIFSLA